MCDLLWSDPDDRGGWGISPRGAGYTFGQVKLIIFIFLFASIIFASFKKMDRAIIRRYTEYTILPQKREC